MRVIHDPSHRIEEADPWLARWLPLIGGVSTGLSVLELGCDTGRDTDYLTRHGVKVLATDISTAALQACAAKVPTAILIRHDLQEPFPFLDKSFGVVIGSLCLHYFTWEKTKDIVQEIHRCLTRDGLLLCRLNSTRDVHHGAQGHVAIEPNYYRVKGTYSDRKRFFDLAAVESLFGEQWSHVSIEEVNIARYQRTKVVWEVVVRKR